jgi:DNA-binding LacI/PurR family transcriptional regulator
MKSITTKQIIEDGRLGRRSQEVLNTLTEELDLGVYPVGTTLPPERELAERFGVSRPTIRRAAAILESNGRIRTRHGSGMTVCAPQLTRRRSGTISVMGMFDEDRLRTMQTAMLRRGFMLCPFSVTARQFDPEVERLFLAQVQRERHHGLVAFCSPLPPLNADLLQAIALDGTRVVHVAPFRLAHPDQDYLLPDYELTGRLAAERLKTVECPTAVYIRMAESPYEMLLERGFRKAFPDARTAVCTASMLTHPPVRRQFSAMLAELPAGCGFFCRSGRLAADLLQLRADCAPGKPVRVIAADEPECRPSPLSEVSYDRLVLPSQAERTDRAVELMLRNAGLRQRELLPPTWQPGCDPVISLGS